MVGVFTAIIADIALGAVLDTRRKFRLFLGIYTFRYIIPVYYRICSPVDAENDTFE